MNVNNQYFPAGKLDTKRPDVLTWCDKGGVDLAQSNVSTVGRYIENIIYN